ncbi:MAG: hypothetical protein NZT61_04750 [Deltaproteobacteria bacterium]|nr:hypothetical protein [Deltaproteobacteria bacterium]
MERQVTSNATDVGSELIQQTKPLQVGSMAVGWDSSGRLCQFWDPKNRCLSTDQRYVLVPLIELYSEAFEKAATLGQFLQRFSDFNYPREVVSDLGTPKIFTCAEPRIEEMVRNLLVAYLRIQKSSVDSTVTATQIPFEGVKIYSDKVLTGTCPFDGRWQVVVYRKSEPSDKRTHTLASPFERNMVTQMLSSKKWEISDIKIPVGPSQYHYSELFVQALLVSTAFQTKGVVVDLPMSSYLVFIKDFVDLLPESVRSYLWQEHVKELINTCSYLVDLYRATFENIGISVEWVWRDPKSPSVEIVSTEDFLKRIIAWLEVSYSDASTLLVDPELSQRMCQYNDVIQILLSSKSNKCTLTGLDNLKEIRIYTNSLNPVEAVFYVAPEAIIRWSQGLIEPVDKTAVNSRDPYFQPHIVPELDLFQRVMLISGSDQIPTDFVGGKVL